LASNGREIRVDRPANAPRNGAEATALVGAAVKRFRQAAGLTLSELARRSGVGKATLSQLEAGERNPTLDTLFALTTALGVPLGALLEEAGQRTASGDAVDAVLLDRYSGTRRTGEAFRLSVRPVQQLSEPHAAGTLETLVVLEGTVRTGPAREPVDLGAGEAFTFPGDLPHLYSGIGGIATCLLVITYTT
jgi:transcriptional regulator with XRE-family HTH domain